MNKKKLLGLISLTCLIVASLLISVWVLIDDRADKADKNKTQISEDINDNESDQDGTDGSDNINDNKGNNDKTDSNDNLPNDDEVKDQNDSGSNLGDKNTLGEDNPDNSLVEGSDKGSDEGSQEGSNDNSDDKSDDEGEQAQDTLKDGVAIKPDLGLIIDSTTIDYMSFLPEPVYTSQMKVALDIPNPSIDIEAKAAILFDLETKEVLYHKNAGEHVFPASTAKLLSCLVALDICTEGEQVTVGEEVNYMASDSSRAYLKKDQILTIRNLLEGMLLPSGNDAAYVTAVYVGRKSLGEPKASGEAALLEFMRLMNDKAKSLGADNSCFKTPDGYDAIGQYTTAYDMGLIGMAAAENETIIQISKKSSSRNIFVSGQDITWENSNHLVNKNEGGYFPYAIGLKTGSSTMAGKSLIGAARQNDKTVICVIMNSTTYGRYEDAIKLLKYGLK